MFLSYYFKSDTLEEQFSNREFLKDLAFLSDIIRHLNDLNAKLQDKDQTVPNLFGNVNGFRNRAFLKHV